MISGDTNYGLTSYLNWRNKPHLLHLNSKQTWDCSLSICFLTWNQSFLEKVLLILTLPWWLSLFCNYQKRIVMGSPIKNCYGKFSPFFFLFSPLQIINGHTLCYLNSQFHGFNLRSIVCTCIFRTGPFLSHGDKYTYRNHTSCISCYTMIKTPDLGRIRNYFNMEPHKTTQNHPKPPTIPKRQTNF